MPAKRIWTYELNTPPNVLIYGPARLEFAGLMLKHLASHGPAAMIFDNDRFRRTGHPNLPAGTTIIVDGGVYQPLFDACDVAIYATENGFEGQLTKPVSDGHKYISFKPAALSEPDKPKAKYRGMIIARRRAVEGASPVPAHKPRGRPKGSKNKPK